MGITYLERGQCHRTKGRNFQCMKIWAATSWWIGWPLTKVVVCHAAVSALFVCFKLWLLQKHAKHSRPVCHHTEVGMIKKVYSAAAEPFSLNYRYNMVHSKRTHVPTSQRTWCLILIAAFWTWVSNTKVIVKHTAKIALVISKLPRPVAEGTPQLPRIPHPGLSITAPRERALSRPSTRFQTSWRFLTVWQKKTT